MANDARDDGRGGTAGERRGDGRGEARTKRRRGQREDKGWHGRTMTIWHDANLTYTQECHMMHRDATISHERLLLILFARSIVLRFRPSFVPLYRIVHRSIDLPMMLHASVARRSLPSSRHSYVVRRIDPHASLAASLGGSLRYEDDATIRATECRRDGWSRTQQEAKVRSARRRQQCNRRERWSEER